MRGVVSQLTCPVTLKVRTGYTSSVDVAHALLAQAQAWGVCAATVHGRSRQQRCQLLPPNAMPASLGL